MSALPTWIVVISISIRSLWTQSLPVYEWQYALWSAHNTIRSRVATGSIDNQPFSTNMEQILYESNMEQVPLQHALRCNYTPNSDLGDDINSIADQLSFKLSTFEPFGENIAYFELSNGSFSTATDLQNIIEQQWFMHQSYDYSNDECSDANDCSFYQKLLWSKTRYMACGVSICPLLSFPDDDSMDAISDAMFIVCDYWPSYDQDELPIYETMDIDDDITDNVCTACATDRSTECTDGLCAGCAAPNYNYCQDRIPVCEVSADYCNTDIVIQLYCPYTCSCSEQDWVPDTECKDLYLDAPIHDWCHRLGWFDVEEIENNASIHCDDGYTLASMDTIEFVEANCLRSDDVDLLDDVIKKAGTDYRPNGIAIDWVQYDIGCDWNQNYKHGVITTHNGIKCGDRKQLFICVQDAMDTEAPTIDDYVISTTQMDTESPTDTASPSYNPTVSPSSKPTESPTSKPTEEPTEEDDTEAPTSSPTEGPTFSPSVEPTDVPSIETTVEVEVPATTEELKAFRMYLLFPDELQDVDDDLPKDARRLSSNQKRDFDDSYVELYPSHGATVSLAIENDVEFGYEFSLTKKVEHELTISLSEVIYTIDANECDLKGDWIQFRLFQKHADEWLGIERIGYNVTKTNSNVEHEWMDVVIGVEPFALKFNVVYKFMIDVSLLRNNCGRLSHPIYGKSFGKFDIERSHFIINGLKSVTGHTMNKYWMKMSIKFTGS